MTKKVKLKTLLVNSDKDELFFWVCNKSAEFGYIKDMGVPRPLDSEVRRLAARLGMRLSYKKQILFFLCSDMKKILSIKEEDKHLLLELGRVGEVEFQEALKKKKISKQ